MEEHDREHFWGAVTAGGTQARSQGPGPEPGLLLLVLHDRKAHRPDCHLLASAMNLHVAALQPRPCPQIAQSDAGKTEALVAASLAPWDNPVAAAALSPAAAAGRCDQGRWRSGGGAATVQRVADRLTPPLAVYCFIFCTRSRPRHPAGCAHWPLTACCSCCSGRACGSPPTARCCTRCWRPSARSGPTMPRVRRRCDAPWRAHGCQVCGVVQSTAASAATRPPTRVSALTPARPPTPDPPAGNPSDADLLALAKSCFSYFSAAVRLGGCRGAGLERGAAAAAWRTRMPPRPARLPVQALALPPVLSGSLTHGVLPRAHVLLHPQPRCRRLTATSPPPRAPRTSTPLCCSWTRCARWQRCWTAAPAAAARWASG